MRGVDTRMHEEPQALDPRRFRRRLPLELTPDELTLLEHLQAEHGSKRATLIAGLHALAAQPAPHELAQLEHSRDRATAEADALRAKVAELEAAAKKAAASASRRDAASANADAAAKADARAAKTQLAKLERDLAHATRDAVEWEQAHAALDALRVDGLRCPRCEEWAAPEEWATTETDDGYLLIYHQPCGYHEKSFTSVPTIMGYRRAD
jgi:hypothetical protein